MALHVVYEAILDPHPSVVVEDFDPEPLLTEALSGRGTVVVLMCHMNITNPGEAEGAPDA